MLILFETCAGHAVFKVLDEGKLADVDNIHTHFETPEAAANLVRLKGFKKFKDTTEAVAAAASLVDNTLDSGLKKLLKKTIVSKGLTDELGVIDAKYGGMIKESLGIKIAHSDAVLEVIRGIRSQLSTLLDGVGEPELKAMSLGLSHSLSRYKLKFSPDKVDTMIVQAINLLDELDKEINTYAMRTREWYGWHFPELSKVITENLPYAKAVHRMGIRTTISTHDFSDILAPEVESEMRETAEISMGTEISEQDIMNIRSLCEQVIALTESRARLYEYLQNRMNAIAPNLTMMVGELVGARLISHAGSLMNLAKQPASTVQILGAEKALFRALKTKHDTPKYGLIYHASLIGQAPAKHKGKISRVLAAKTALAIRVDALGEGSDATVGLEGRAKVEARIRVLEGGVAHAAAGTKSGSTPAKYTAPAAATPTYNAGSDAAGLSGKKAKKDKKRKADAIEEAAPATSEKKDKSAKKAAKKAKLAAEAEAATAAAAAAATPD
jgi:nucleolar protein 58